MAGGAISPRTTNRPVNLAPWQGGALPGLWVQRWVRPHSRARSAKASRPGANVRRPSRARHPVRTGLGHIWVEVGTGEVDSEMGNGAVAVFRSVRFISTT
jgi:hypothetical protein